ncbi:lipocalin-like domain-containing protein [Streptomyces sp. NPDC054775]
MSRTINAETLQGSWRLTDVREHQRDAQIFGDAYGHHVHGSIMYSLDGHMSVVIRGERAGEPLYVAYAGTYEVHAERIIHKVDVGVPPFDIDQVRYAQMTDDDTLRLATASEGEPRFELTWQRNREARGTDADDH